MVINYCHSPIFAICLLTMFQYIFITSVSLYWCNFGFSLSLRFSVAFLNHLTRLGVIQRIMCYGISTILMQVWFGLLLTYIDLKFGRWILVHQIPPRWSIAVLILGACDTRWCLILWSTSKLFYILWPVVFYVTSGTFAVRDDHKHTLKKKLLCINYWSPEPPSHPLGRRISCITFRFTLPPCFMISSDVPRPA
jgi:hypothetical protein